MYNSSAHFNLYSIFIAENWGTVTHSDRFMLHTREIQYIIYGILPDKTWKKYSPVHSVCCFGYSRDREMRMVGLPEGMQIKRAGPWISVCILFWSLGVIIWKVMWNGVNPAGEEEFFFKVNNLDNEMETYRHGTRVHKKTPRALHTRLLPGYPNVYVQQIINQTVNNCLIEVFPRGGFWLKEKLPQQRRHPAWVPDLISRHGAPPAVLL